MEKSKQQISASEKKLLEKQQYRIIGSHSAVKICGWTKNMLAGKGGCYKYKFYGIRSHQCLQMTTSMFCANRCNFCWRSLKAPVSKDWYGEIDAPEAIIPESINSHIKLLQGFKGNEKASKSLISQMHNIHHVALSLTGEPITYPKINELINEFHKRKISTFLVTNAQYPEQIKKLSPVTQLYLSIDAPDKETLKKIDNPLFTDFWERMNKSLEILKTLNYRTCIRLTLIRNHNMKEIKGYAELIKKGSPDFIEVKSYMWVGASQKFYKTDNMPNMQEIREFSKAIAELMPDYEIMDEHIPSRVVLMAKKSLDKKQFINFNKFFELVNSNKSFTAEDYSSETIMPNNCYQINNSQNGLQ